MRPPLPSHHPDPVVQTLVGAALDGLPALRDSLESGDGAAADGVISSVQQEALLQVIERLCVEERFEQAAPLVLQLAVRFPSSSRCSFTAARVFQRLAVFDVAAVLYGLCLQQQRKPIVMYRLGECLAGLGRGDEAIRLFDAAFDLARGDDACRGLQDAAMQAIGRLRSSLQPA